MKIFHLSTSEISGGAARSTNRIHQALLNKDFDSVSVVDIPSEGDSEQQELLLFTSVSIPGC